jgi:prepilin-type N-terminal cleavage/methylation domain-containing protein
MDPLRGSREGAFTLIEIVVALTIIAIIAAVAIPTLKGIGREERARAPVAALASLVQEVRARALRERKPYQIVFEKTGLHGLADGFPTANREVPPFFSKLWTRLAPRPPARNSNGQPQKSLPSSPLQPPSATSPHHRRQPPPRPHPRADGNRPGA